jgi:hypothetical protein
MSAITYIIRKIDLVEFNEYHAKMNGGYGKSITRHRVIWPAIVAFIALFIVMSSHEAQPGVYMLTAAFVWSVGVPAFLKKKFHEQVMGQLTEADFERATGEYTLKVTELGLLEVKPTGEELIEWSKIIKLEKSKHHVYLYLGPDAAVIIPKEMISEESNFKVFYEELLTALKKVNGEVA